MLAFEAELAHLPRSLIAALWELFDRFSATTWKPSEDTDREVRQWMKAKGWEATGAEYDSEQKIYTWRARSIRSGHSPAVRISQRVLQDYPAFAILEHLDRLNVADAIRRRPDARFVLVQNGLRVALEEASPLRKVQPWWALPSQWMGA